MTVGSLRLISLPLVLVRFTTYLGFLFAVLGTLSLFFLIYYSAIGSCCSVGRTGNGRGNSSSLYSRVIGV